MTINFRSLILSSPHTFFIPASGHFCFISLAHISIIFMKNWTLNGFFSREIIFLAVQRAAKKDYYIHRNINPLHLSSLNAS